MRALRLITMRYMCQAIVVALSILTHSEIFGQAHATGLEPTDVTVGQNLEVSATVTLNGPVPRTGLQVTLSSNDPSLLLLSIKPDAVGSPSIVVNIQPGIREPEFYLQGFAKSGTVTYTASAPGVSSGTGKVTLGPAGIVISGPFGIGKPSFLTTTGAAKTKITVHSVLLDSSLKYVAPQRVAGGRSIDANIANSNPAIGTLASSAVRITGGSSSVTTMFQPVAEGDGMLAVTLPPGSNSAAQFTTVAAKVVTPGLAVTEDIFIGQNLQAGGSLSLGEPAPSSGLVVTLTSNSPQLLLSPTVTGKGSNSLKINILPGGIQGTYYLQSISASGPVTYTVTAPGFRSRTATITLTASGVVVAGPLSFTRAGGSPGFVASLATGKPTPVLVYTAYLDPITHRSADVTVQPLRPGVSLTIGLESSDPAVGTINSPVTIMAASDTAETRFTPLKAGTTIVSVITPKGYTKSSNATALKVIVTD